MKKYKSGTIVRFGWRTTGGFNHNCGVVLPYSNRGNNLFILSDYNCEVHMMRQTSRGTWILASEKRDDPKHRLDMQALTEAEKQQLGGIGIGEQHAGFQNWALYESHINPENTAAEWDTYQRRGGGEHG
jgi:hypothetical protein